MDDFFDELPDDPDLAFLHLERTFRQRYQQKIDLYRSDDFPAEIYLEYISCVLASKMELELDILEGWKVPSASDFHIDHFNDFRRDVDHFITALRIRHSRRVKGYSVRLDQATKSKIIHYIDKIREIVEVLEIDDWRKRVLFEKLSDFQNAVNKERTKFEYFGSLVIYSAEILGSAAQKAEPARKFIDSIARLIWGVDIEERSSRLPPPAERKRIEPPKNEPAPPRKATRDRNHIDDDIPF